MSLDVKELLRSVALLLVPPYSHAYSFAPSPRRASVWGRQGAKAVNVVPSGVFLFGNFTLTY